VNETFITGLGAVIAAVVVFCGSVWMLLTIVLGARLAYFVTAAVTLAFVLIMGLVWSFTQLGPVGELPTFNPEAIGEGGQVDFGAAGSYPEGDWFVPPEDDEAEQAKIAELESAALDYLETAIEEGRVDAIESADQGQVVPDSARLLTEGDEQYGGVLLEPIPETADEGGEDDEIDPTAPDTVLAIMKFDPGNPTGLARQITIGVFLLFVLHLFGLSRSERKAKELREERVA
jgi:hypothetical protein